jgi:hypothetical protein
MKYTVSINGTVVGFLSTIEVDQPWFSGLFEPLPSFDTYRALFTDLRHAFRDERYEDADALSRQVDGLDIQIGVPDGRVLYATHAHRDAPASITCVRFDVRFESGIMSWRPGVEFVA